MYTSTTAAGDRQVSRQRRPDNARRLLLLQTTLRLIGEQGIDAVNHRSVAEAAGVSLGSTTYWFSSRHEMLRQALEHFARLEIETLRDRLSGVLDGRRSRRRIVDAFTAILVPQLDEERWRTVAQYTLLQEAAREPELEPVCRDWTQEWLRLLSEVFTSLRVRDPELEAKLFLALLDGLLINQLAVPDRDVEQTAIRPALEAWFKRLPVQ